MGYLHTADFTEYQGGENILLYFDWGCNSIVDFEAALWQKCLDTVMDVWEFQTKGLSGYRSPSAPAFTELVVERKWRMPQESSEKVCEITDAP